MMKSLTQNNLLGKRNMLNRWKHPVAILTALIAGALFAGAFTHITYPCPLLPGENGCIRYEKAVMHPIDLVSNVQGSLVHFLLNELVGFIIVIVILIALSKLRRNKPLELKT